MVVSGLDWRRRSVYLSVCLSVYLYLSDLHYDHRLPSVVVVAAVSLSTRRRCRRCRWVDHYRESCSFIFFRSRIPFRPSVRHRRLVNRPLFIAMAPPVGNRSQTVGTAASCNRPHWLTAGRGRSKTTNIPGICQAAHFCPTAYCMPFWIPDGTVFYRLSAKILFMNTFGRQLSRHRQTNVYTCALSWTNSVLGFAIQHSSKPVPCWDKRRRSVRRVSILCL